MGRYIRAALNFLNINLIVDRNLEKCFTCVENADLLKSVS